MREKSGLAKKLKTPGHLLYWAEEGERFFFKLLKNKARDYIVVAGLPWVSRNKRVCLRRNTEVCWQRQDDGFQKNIWKSTGEEFYYFHVNILPLVFPQFSMWFYAKRSECKMRRDDNKIIWCYLDRKKKKKRTKGWEDHCEVKNREFSQMLNWV